MDTFGCYEYVIEIKNLNTFVWIEFVRYDINLYNSPKP